MPHTLAAPHPYEGPLTPEHLRCWFTPEAAADALELPVHAVREGLANFQRRNLIRHDREQDRWLLDRPGASSTPRQLALQLGELALVSARLARVPQPGWFVHDITEVILLERLLALRARS